MRYFSICNRERIKLLQVVTPGFDQILAHCIMSFVRETIANIKNKDNNNSMSIRVHPNLVTVKRRSREAPLRMADPVLRTRLMPHVYRATPQIGCGWASTGRIKSLMRSRKAKNSCTTEKEAIWAQGAKAPRSKGKRGNRMSEMYIFYGHSQMGGSMSLQQSLHLPDRKKRLNQPSLQLILLRGTLRTLPHIDWMQGLIQCGT